MMLDGHCLKENSILIIFIDVHAYEFTYFGKFLQ